LADLGYLRPGYRRASHSVHAGSRGTALARLPFRGEEFLLVGPSNHGLEIPAGGAMTSLVLTTIDLLIAGTHEPQSIMTSPAILALGLLLHESKESFDAAARDLDRAEAEASTEVAGGRL